MVRPGRPGPVSPGRFDESLPSEVSVPTASASRLQPWRAATAASVPGNSSIRSARDPGRSGTEVLSTAQNAARNRHRAVFPMVANKRPTPPHGFAETSSDPEKITKLWPGIRARSPGSLLAFPVASTCSTPVPSPRKPTAADRWPRE